MPWRTAAADATPMDAFLIITGPGRSGTSAVARILHESGLNMGTALIPPSEWNQVGYYEESPVVELNEQIFLDLGMEGMRRRPSRRDVLDASARYAPEMRRLVADSTACGWKDPRFSVTLEAWLPHFPAPPKVIVCLRSPEAFIDSAISIFGLSPRETLEHWWAYHLRTVLDIIRQHRLEATSVEFDALLRDPAGTVAGLSRFVGRPLDPAHLRPELRHHADRVLPQQRALYEEVLALGRGRRSARGSGRLG